MHIEPDKNVDHIQMLVIREAFRYVPPSSMLSQKLNHGTTCENSFDTSIRV